MFDYIIVGGGSAGCLLANRLSEDPDVRVCLLEAGSGNRLPGSRIPGFGGLLMHSRRCNWGFHTTNGKSLPLFAGRGLGGSSLINALVHCHDPAFGRDMLPTDGSPGWTPDDIHAARDRIDREMGPTVPRSFAFASVERFLDAAGTCGLPVHSELAYTRPGAGPWLQTVQDGQRITAADVWLAPARERANLDVRTDCHVRRILLDGNRAVGVSLESRHGVESVFCRREVIVAAGTYNSPLVLMRSGIGPPEVLDEACLPVVIPSREVGRNLQDHPDYTVVYRSRRREGPALNPSGMLQGAAETLHYMRNRRGFLAHSICEAGAFIHSGEDVTEPDLQLHFLPMCFDDHGRNRAIMRHHGFSCRISLLNPVCRGEIRPGGSDARARPRIAFNPVSAAADVARLARGVEQVRAILSSQPFSQCGGRELLPGTDPADHAATVEAVRARPGTIYHPVGTCRMGRDAGAVVDADLRVHGAQGLRVIDASVMPSIPAANTHASTLMIAEIGSRRIRADASN